MKESERIYLALDIIGDVHGCYDELLQLINQLGYINTNGTYTHPKERRLAFVGDLTDRGPHSLQVIELVYQLVIVDHIAIYVPGNHCNKLYRYFLGNNVEIKHGLETTVREYQSLTKKAQQIIKEKFMLLYDEAPLYYYDKNLNIVVSHAGILDRMIGETNRHIKAFVLYGPKSKDHHPDGRPVRIDWTPYHEGRTFVIYGHTPVLEPYRSNNTINIDLGCVFGNKLMAIQIPEHTTVSVKSKQPFQPDRFTDFSS